MTNGAIFDYLRTVLAIDTSSLDDDSPLISSGIVDSLALVDLLLFLQVETGARVEPGEIALEHFDTVGRMLAFLTRKTTRRAGEGG